MMGFRVSEEGGAKEVLIAILLLWFPNKVEVGLSGCDCISLGNQVSLLAHLLITRKLSYGHTQPTC